MTRTERKLGDKTEDTLAVKNPWVEGGGSDTEIAGIKSTSTRC